MKSSNRSTPCSPGGSHFQYYRHHHLQQQHLQQQQQQQQQLPYFVNELKGYSVHSIVHSGRDSCILRGYCYASRRPVIIKSHSCDIPSVAMKNRLTKDFSIGKLFSSPSTPSTSNSSNDHAITATTSGVTAAAAPYHHHHHHHSLSDIHLIDQHQCENEEQHNDDSDIHHHQHQQHNNHIIQYYYLENYGAHRIVIIMEDYGAISLSEFEQSLHSANTRISITDFVKIALQLVDGLSTIHQAGVIHCSVASYNIVIHPETHLCKYIDFGHSSQLLNETVSPLISANSFKDRSIEYISPEQTGRMNQLIDYRTDFYSLGIVLYELLTGAVPFRYTNDPLEIFYSHLVKIPAPPHQVDGSIPVYLSDIVMKLLSKNSNERYQSAYGLKMDLEHSMVLLNRRVSLSTTFHLAKSDASSTFTIGQKLYGREAEIKELWDTFTQISQGHIRSTLLLVNGTSGIGKTSIINEIHKPLVRHKGYFISGKFEQFKKQTIPYAPLIHAFQQLMQILLAESEEQIDYWRKKLIEALQRKAGIICDVIPDIELIIGRQPSVANLDASDNDVRFKRVFIDFINVFCSKSHPLVLFLDDLQWCDLSTAQLLEAILTDPCSQYLLVIGAYRHNEVTEVHPLKIMTSNIEEKVKVREMHLDPLKVSDITCMLADSLGCTKDKCQALSQLVAAKTEGNPFFVKVFMGSLVQDKLIYFDFSKGCWRWDLQKINNAAINVEMGEVLKRKMGILSKPTQNLLSYASIIGNTFDLKLLSIVCGMSMSETAASLWPALYHNFIYQQMGGHNEYEYRRMSDELNEVENMEFTFTHDRIQSSVYDMLNEDIRVANHLTIARHMLQSLETTQQEEKLFDILAHFRSSRKLLTDPNEKLLLSELSLKAARKAKESIAYATAVSYLQFGIDLLSADSWEIHYSLTFDMYRLLCECECSLKNFEGAKRLYPILMANAKNEMDVISIHCIQMAEYELKEQFGEASGLMFFCLDLLGVKIPSDPQELELELQKELAAVKVNLAGRRIEDLIHAPEITDPRLLLIIRLMVKIFTPVYGISQHTLLSVMCAKMCNFCLVHGICDVASMAFVFFSFILGFKSGDFLTGYKFGCAGIKLADKYNNHMARTQAYHIFGFGSCSWVQPLRVGVDYMAKACDIGISNGYYALPAYSVSSRSSELFFQGENLVHSYAIYDKYITNWLQTHNAIVYIFTSHVTMPYRYLLGKMEPQEMDVDPATLPFPIIKSGYLFGCMVTHYFAEEYEKSLEFANRAYEGRAPFWGSWKWVEVHVFVALVYMAVCRPDSSITISDDDRRLFMERVDSIIEMMQTFAANCPSNFSHKVYLLQAEKALVEHKQLEVVDLYESAADSARQNGFSQYEALAKELCAQFWVKRNRLNYARLNMQEAYDLWSIYGAKTKVKQLEAKYSSLLNSNNHSRFDVLIENNADEDAVIGDTYNSPIDLLTVMKACRALSNETKLEMFLDNMMKLIIENTGAQMAVFLLVEPGNKLLVCAECDMDSMTNTIRAVPLDSFSRCAKTIVHYVARTRKTVVLGDCTSVPPQFESDTFLLENHVKSILCMPVMKQDTLQGILYLDNKVSTDAFTNDRSKVLDMLSAQMIMQLENAKFSSLLESEKKYRALATELEERKKNLEEFIDVLCHELRNPLNAIYGNTNIISDYLPLINFRQSDPKYLHGAILDPEMELREAVEAISSSAHHLKDIVDTVLNISALENRTVVLQSVVFRPTEIIVVVASMFKAQLQEKKLKLILELAEDSQQTVVVGDAYRFKEIVINLLSNSIKFTASGSITIRTSHQHTTTDKLLWEVQISDTGIGLDAQEQSRLFKPFSQATNHTYIKFGGSGLGLKICKDLVELMNGTIFVKSEKGEGSTFVFQVQFDQASPSDVETVLLSDEENEQVMGKISAKRRVQSNGTDDATVSQVTKVEDKANNTCVGPSQSISNNNSSGNGTDNTALLKQPQQPQQQKEKDTRTKRILVVEDNPINAKLLMRILQMGGYMCSLAENGLEAVNTVVGDHGYDLVFMDLEMPVMGGIDATRSIRKYEGEQELDPVPIVAVSANARKEFLESAFSAGMADYITKPYLKQDVYNTVEKWSR